MSVATLDLERILQILPQRPPLLLVERVSELWPGDRIVAHKAVSINEPWFQGPSTGRPILPGVLVIEALAQAAGLLAYATEPFDAQRSLLYFLGIEKAKFRRPVSPGDRLDLHAHIAHHRTNVWKFQGEALVEGTLCAQAELVFSVVDRHG